MEIVDVHAHVTPDRFVRGIESDGQWHGLGPDAGELHIAGFRKPLDQRLEEMEEIGVDRQLITPNVGLYAYDRPIDVATKITAECNDAIHEIVSEHPDRFSGLGIVPLQDVQAAVAELERIVELGLHGAVIGDHVDGRTYDEPEFRPFFAAAERLGAILFVHQGGETITMQRNRRYMLGNAVGNLAERALTFGALVFGGVMDRYPGLQVILGHGGGYTASGIARMDKVAGALEGTGPGLHPPFGEGSMAGSELTKPPSAYLSSFWYDCCTYDGDMLRLLLDKVGSDRVMLGTDYPAPMTLLDSVAWVRSLEVLTEEEKQRILADNAERLLRLPG